MRFGPAPSDPPTENLLHFTNRVDELELFRTRITGKAGIALPMLMFYGVGGAGKTWLLRKMREAAAAEKLPAARLDFAEDVGGGRYHSDPAAALADLSTQLEVSCPQFELAYAMMLHRQGGKEGPAMRHGATAGTAWELAGELVNATLQSIPGGNILVWFGKKAGERAALGLRDTALGRWLASTAGNADLLQLREMSAQEIYPTLVRRLAADLAEQLPRAEGRACRAVLFLDAFEHLCRSRLTAALQFDRERWIADLWAALHEQDAAGRWRPFVQVVLAGRDRVTWPEFDEECRSPEVLEQHRVGGLSRPDAIAFFGRCGITDARLQDALLDSCRDTDTGGRDPGYHAFKLGLFADAVLEERRRGMEPDPETYRLPPAQLDRLIRRFLQSLPNDTSVGQIRRLALTPRFDETAGRANFPAADPAATDAEWEHLLRFSFVQPAAEPGWSTLHPQMREGLRLDASAGNREVERRDHRFWQQHWSGRSRTPHDGFAALAWYHNYCLDREGAARTWIALAEQARSALRMRDHFDLLDWWPQTGLEADRHLDGFEASLLVSLGLELWRATLGSTTANLERAIACYEAALRVYTEAAFPQDWARTQNNLGGAYADLHRGDRAANVRRAIACYEAVLRVYTESAFPQDWARTQNNLGVAHWSLPGGDRTAHLERAITCYEAALRVVTEAAFPQACATIQNNLGRAHADLPGEERDSNLTRAITYYEASLREFSEAAFPQACATIQNNLGLAYADLPGRDRAANLERAITCYEAALRGRTEAAFPQDWAMTQNNLGIALRELGNPADARRAFDAAARGFRAVGLHESAAVVEALIAQLPPASPEDNLPV